MATELSHQRPLTTKPVVTTVPFKGPSTSESESLCDSYASDTSDSTAPTSFHSNLTSRNKHVVSDGKPQTIASSFAQEAVSASSVATFNSALSEMEPLCREHDLSVDCKSCDHAPQSLEEEEEEEEEEEDVDLYSEDSSDEDESDEDEDDERDRVSDPDSLHIPRVLPPYRGCPSSDTPVRPSTSQDFARLFPSLDRLFVHHDDHTSDGNMNLRVDTVVPMNAGRRHLTIQLFHLRMHDLARREFSFRRYCRDSGREVCNAKREYAASSASSVTAASPTLHRSMSTALRSVTIPFHRTNSATSSIFKRPGSSNGSGNSNLASSDGASIWSGSHHSIDSAETNAARPKPCLTPTNRIKLEFSNYARVDVSRRGGRTNKRYEYDWWGHQYTWKRVIDDNLSTVSYHLTRDGHGAPIAHIVPEMRSPNQKLDDEMAGAWVPPCYMWICDSSILEAVTDVADVIVATGLIALVDDSIKERWQAKKPSHKAIRPRTTDSHSTSPREMVHNLFQRRHSHDPHSSNKTFRLSRRPVPTY